MILKQALKIKHDTDLYNTETCFNTSTFAVALPFFSVGLYLLPMELSAVM